ncbi:MAG: bifunctional 2-polyprenyl-6-hydroxyphenol methylase/3-demethylubiquinol 3-O-methyltransferase UbiG [Parasphingorhabdus sp.]|nr:bifunctional 2-polyprenyl-6-hydroxyphenol methylase/3-demethylubiquinol 3-O-methyltransferase UbiG [Parasphingorhabdus sp.]
MAKTSQRATIDAKEAAHFNALAQSWWDPKGSSAMLHRLNPVRLNYIRQAIDQHFGGDGRALKPLAGKRALDVGCGAGLLAEPLARLGANVTAIDAASENIAVAAAHAAAQGLVIDYRHCGIEDLDETDFDLVTSLEVIEHVTDPAVFVGGLATALGAAGLLILSTPNRTAMSRLMLVELAERTGQIPRGTHDWDKFLKPEELEALLADAGLSVTDVTGMKYDPLYGFALSDNLALNYLVTAVRD